MLQSSFDLRGLWRVRHEDGPSPAGAPLPSTTGDPDTTPDM